MPRSPPSPHSLAMSAGRSDRRALDEADRNQQPRPARQTASTTAIVSCRIAKSGSANSYPGEARQQPRCRCRYRGLPRRFVDVRQKAKHLGAGLAPDHVHDIQPRHHRDGRHRATRINRQPIRRAETERGSHDRRAGIWSAIGRPQQPRQPRRPGCVHAQQQRQRREQPDRGTASMWPLLANAQTGSGFQA